jgi:DNA-binding HxlR family transcriptional regulator
VRTYHQYCAVAKALDVIGDRWTLLIVRELVLRGPSRYTDLRRGLPGIATNLLAERLRELEDGGIVAREQAPPPVATALFSLTERGEALRPVLDALAVWGSDLMAAGPAQGDEFHAHWLAWPAERFLSDTTPDGPPLTVELDAGGEAVLARLNGGKVEVRPGSGPDADVRISGEPYPMLGLLSGGLDLDQARAAGVSVEGSAGALARLGHGAA